MLPDKYVIVDTETTGTSARHDRIIEVGLIRVEKGEVVKEFQTLLNPGGPISPFISDLTGITQDQVYSAPAFYEIKDELWEYLSDAVLVAHNARFDYGFLRYEFKRSLMDYRSQMLCTVRLSRALFPRYRRHNLDSIIERFQIPFESRHRALDDAKIVQKFLDIARDGIQEQDFTKAVSFILKKPSLPPQLKQEAIDKLPEGSGVYIFYGEDPEPLYIGKSINIRDRVLSHFSQDYNSSIDMNLSQQVRRIDVIRTAGELGALLTESALIKKLNPIYNRLLRNKRKVVIYKKTETEDGYLTVSIEESDNLDAESLEHIMGVFKSKKQARETLRKIAQEYGLCLRLLGLEKGSGACFFYHLGTCKGACKAKEKTISYNMKFTMAFSQYRIKDWPFQGPIIITEDGEELAEQFVIDKWCLLGSIKSEGDLLEFADYHFDYDIYKIFLSYLKKEKNTFTVKNLGDISQLNTT